MVSHHFPYEIAFFPMVTPHFHGGTRSLRPDSDDLLQELPNDDMFRLWKARCVEKSNKNLGNIWDSFGWELVGNIYSNRLGIFQDIPTMFHDFVGDMSHF